MDVDDVDEPIPQPDFGLTTKRSRGGKRGRGGRRAATSHVFGGNGAINAAGKSSRDDNFEEQIEGLDEATLMSFCIESSLSSLTDEDAAHMLEAPIVPQTAIQLEDATSVLHAGIPPEEPEENDISTLDQLLDAMEATPAVLPSPPVKKKKAGAPVIIAPPLVKKTNPAVPVPPPSVKKANSTASVINPHSASDDDSPNFSDDDTESDDEDTTTPRRKLGRRSNASKQKLSGLFAKANALFQEAAEETGQTREDLIERWGESVGSPIKVSSTNWWNVYETYFADPETCGMERGRVNKPDADGEPFCTFPACNKLTVVLFI